MRDVADREIFADALKECMLEIIETKPRVRRGKTAKPRQKRESGLSDISFEPVIVGPHIVFQPVSHPDDTAGKAAQELAWTNKAIGLP